MFMRPETFTPTSEDHSMRLRSASAVILLVLLAASPSLASFGGGGMSPSQPPPSGEPGPDATQLTPRQQAERLYGDAYDEVAKAKKDLDEGNAKNAAKKFKHALDRGRQAVALDSTYHEAWNLVGFTSRKLNDYPGALAAYDHCLRIKPDFAPAREYLGEAYVEMGQPKKAREQLVWLEHLGQDDQAKSLKDKIVAYETAHPDTTAAPTASPAARADSTAASGSSSQNH
jgi:tetratricopeptide (TPR) repeat protein